MGVGSGWGKMSLLMCFVVVATQNEWTIVPTSDLEWVDLESSAALHAGSLVDFKDNMGEEGGRTNPDMVWF